MESAKVMTSRNLPLGHRTLDLSRQSGHMSPQSSKSTDKSTYFCSSVCLEFQHYARLRVICLQDQNCPRDPRRRSFPLFILSITFPLLRLLISGRVQIWDFVFRRNARLKNQYCKRMFIGSERDYICTYAPSWVVPATAAQIADAILRSYASGPCRAVDNATFALASSRTEIH